MELNATYISRLSRLFSPGVIQEMAKKGKSPIFARTFQETGLLNESLLNGDVGRAFDAAFSILKVSGQRNEYVYRSALTHNILLGRHSLKTASMLTEFRAGSSKADLVILNGTSTVYEIKSERDSLNRLEKQIENYRKVFAKIYIIAAENFTEELIKNISNDIGIMSLTTRNRIHTIRESTSRSELVCPLTILDSLRTSEACEILQALKIPIPDVPNTLIRSSIQERFSTLDPSEVHNLMVKTLKRTRNLASLGSLIEQLPESLQAAALSTTMRRADHERLVNAVRTPFNKAMSWA
ncbi:sce7726 family protein [Chromobacterium haemolyticum]|uniref:sce7726 family protein n=1 Tax=Chromobacterium haemolyticum TaxID=394935 RepID=UPI00244754FB|nr:sce7726 family protein [Chromobacterium haemolyticum]MDH0340338.1 sce7726 family protein [Chromobacterium haemolyticum]